MENGLFRHVRPGRAPNEKKLALSVLVAVVLLGAVVASFGYIFWYQLRFRAFWSDLSNSTVYAYEQGGASASLHGAAALVQGQDLYDVYTVVVGAGTGKLQGSVPQAGPDIALDYGDGSLLELWEAPVENGIRSIGVLLRYTSQQGKTFIFDTDQFTIREVDKLLRW